MWIAGLSLDTLISAMAAASAFLAVLVVCAPLLTRDRTATRIALIAGERRDIRRRERAKTAAKTERSMLGTEAKPLAQAIFERFGLAEQAQNSALVQRLRMAGYRGKGRVVTFLAISVVTPLIGGALAALYVFMIAPVESFAGKWAIIVAAACAGYYAPSVFLKNKIAKRQQSITRAWPDVLDLLMICVQSGMSLDSSIKKVSEEIAGQSIDAAEELAVLSAELSYLTDRRQAFENLVQRTGLDAVKAVTTSLVQAEKYGTAVAQALRVLAQESRDTRMSLAEKKAASLPPKLTVPMILFFLPVLFAVIMTPAILQIVRM